MCDVTNADDVLLGKEAANLEGPMYIVMLVRKSRSRGAHRQHNVRTSVQLRSNLKDVLNPDRVTRSKPSRNSRNPVWKVALVIGPIPTEADATHIRTLWLRGNPNGAMNKAARGVAVAHVLHLKSYIEPRVIFGQSIL